MSTKIASIDPRSPAHRAGICPGETLLEVNGNPIVDVLDYKFYTYDPRLTLLLEQEDGTKRSVRIRKAEGEELGLSFETYLMDHAHRCANNCIFCFVDQMPGGLRDTLYFKDDDERLSFLMGNYVTLTNLSPREIQRIIDLRISPINVSVHTTDPALRVEMMGNRFAGRSIDIMRRFAQAGIQMNCQIVACPGVNDGDKLRRTMADLTEMRSGVSSCAIVPVGLTKYREGLYPLRPYTKQEAAALLDMVEAYGNTCLERYGRRMFWCSDEFYLLSERELPPDEFYDDYCQLENGVGMLRLLEVEFRGALKVYEGEECSPLPYSIATGRSAAPLIARLAAEADRQFSSNGQVYTIENDFFGHQITVAGLITGQDLIAQLRDKPLGERLLLPDCMLRYHQNVFLDDYTVEQVQEALGVPITFVPSDGFKLLEAILQVEDTGPEEREDFFPEDDEYFRYNPD
jgi:putative radical SAM enzyme (TIGR03279 family)